MQSAHLAQRVEEDEARGGVGGVPGDRGPQAVLSDEEFAAVAVVQIVGSGLRVALGGPQPAGDAEGLPRLLPRGVGELQSPVDDREGIPGLVLAQPALAGTRARQVRRTNEVPCGEIEGLDAAVIVQETADAPAALPGLHRGIGGLIQASDLGVRPAGPGAALAQAREILAVPGAQKRIDLAEQPLAVRDIPVALQHRLHGTGLRELQLVNGLVVAQRVDHGRGQQASLRVGGHVLALAAQMRGVVLVELVPLAFLAGFAHVARRGNGALRAGGSLLERSRCEGHDDAADREPNRERNVGEEILEHRLIVPDGKQITQFRGACAHHVGRGRGWVVCPSTGLVDRLAS